jgi:hypothetical protein
VCLYYCILPDGVPAGANAAELAHAAFRPYSKSPEPGFRVWDGRRFSAGKRTPAVRSVARE